MPYIQLARTCRQSESGCLAVRARVAVDRVGRLDGAVVAGRADTATSHVEGWADAVENRRARVVRK